MITRTIIQPLIRHVVQGLNANGNFNTGEEMKYTQTINLSAGENTVITTPLTREPYNIELIDADGNVITSGITTSVALVSGVYKVTLYSVDALNNVKLKILY